MATFNPMRSIFGAEQGDGALVPADLSGVFPKLGIEKAYILVITGRCGSTWLAHMLTDAGIGVPMEYFNVPALDHYKEVLDVEELEPFFEGIVRKYSANNIFGMKINPIRLFWLSEIVDLDATFINSGFQWIDMRRNNVVKQAISFTRAGLTGAWHKVEGRKDEGSADAEVPPSIYGSEFKAIHDAIWDNLNKMLEQEKDIDAFYAQKGIVPLRLVYEDLLDSRASVFHRVQRRILGPDAKLVTELPETRTSRVTKEEQWELDFLNMFGDEVEAAYASRS